jgi:hypothetical protein
MYPLCRVVERTAATCPRHDGIDARCDSWKRTASLRANGQRDRVVRRKVGEKITICDGRRGSGRRRLPVIRRDLSVRSAEREAVACAARAAAAFAGKQRGLGLRPTAPAGTTQMVGGAGFEPATLAV